MLPLRRSVFSSRRRTARKSEGLAWTVESNSPVALSPSVRVGPTASGVPEVSRDPREVIGGRRGIPGPAVPSSGCKTAEA